MNQKRKIEILKKFDKTRQKSDAFNKIELSLE
jgi:hypothetical protein